MGVTDVFHFSAWRRPFVWAVALLLFWTLALLLIYRDGINKKNHYLALHSAVAATTYRVTVDSYAMATEILVAEAIRLPQVISIFARGVDGAPAARGQLFRLLAPTYDRLNVLGIRQLHFHTAEGLSYLRFHALDKFDDPLFDVRPSVRIANTQQQMVFGFESGRTSSGFRYVYPLFDGDRHLGSVEASVTFRSIREAMIRNAPQRDFALVLRRAIVENTLFEGNLSLYGAWAVNPDYLVEDPDLKLPDSPPPPSAVVLDVNQVLTQMPAVRTSMAAGKTFSLEVLTGGDHWAASFVPVFDITGQQVAYVVSYASAPNLAALHTDFRRILVLVTVVLTLLFVLAYRLGRNRALRMREVLRMKTINDTIADGLYVMDAWGQVTLINPAFTEILGLAQTEVVGRVGHDLFHVSDRQGRVDPLERCPIYSTVRRGGEYFGEEIFRTREGLYLDVEVASRPIMDVKGKPTGSSVTAFRDITARKAAETDLRDKTIALVRSNAELSRLGEVMTHHFQEPVRRLVSFARHLQEKMELVSDEDCRESLRFIDRQAQRLSDLVRDTQRYLALEHSYRLTDADTSADCATVLRQILAGKVIADAEIVMAESLPVVAVAPDNLRRMFMAVLDNADRYRHPGRPLRVEISAVGVKGRARIRVVDNGSGIAPEYRDQVFELFTRLVPNSVPGTGMGLALVRRIVHQVGGSVKIEDGMDGGICVELTLPLEENP